MMKDPKHLLSEGEHVGFAWITKHNGIGYRCGYIAVGKDHPWYRQDFDQINAVVHGGLTWSMNEGDVYWIGFDCAHCDDAQDPSLPCDSPFASRTYGVIRTTAYVEEECRRLCEQARAAALAAPGKAAIRARALAKLTPEEREELGV